MQQFTQTVIHGKKIGRTIGFPTANLKLKSDFIDDGTYKINIVYNDEIFSGVGVARNHLWLFEAHIFDFEKNIYGEDLEIIILEKIRDNKKFSSLEELKNAIQNDVKTAKNSKNIVMTFGSFDIFHKWHQYFLHEAKKYGDSLITIIARDKNVEKLKWKLPRNTEEFRKKEVENSNIPNEVLLWDETNPLKWIEFYQPKIIALWYDQVWFSEKLKTYDNIEIVRIGSFEPEKYKSSLLGK